MSGTYAPVPYTLPDPSGRAGRHQDQLPVLLTVGIALLTVVPFVPGKLQGLDVVYLLAVPFITRCAAWYGPVCTACVTSSLASRSVSLSHVELAAYLAVAVTSLQTPRSGAEVDSPA